MYTYNRDQTPPPKSQGRFVDVVKLHISHCVYRGLPDIYIYVYIYIYIYMYIYIYINIPSG